MSKRLTVTLTERQWSTVLAIMGDGFDHLEMIMNDGGNDPETTRTCKSMYRDGLKIDELIARQLQEGGAK